MSNYIYLRSLRHVDYAVFAVDKGQKNYWDNQFRTLLPFSGGQQVKRSIIESVVSDNLGEKISPVTFEFNSKLEEKEVYTGCNPQFADLLIGGWMKTGQKTTDIEKGRTIKRRSPLSISAMRPLHPLLAGLPKENISFDRSNKPEDQTVIVRNEKGDILTDEEVREKLRGTDRSLNRKWIQDNSRASGLFIYDIAIDMRTLFCVSTNQFEPELTPETIEALKTEGWKSSKNIFGECLVCPSERRDQIIKALANGLINWRITSNQSRTFSLMETLAIAISDNANQIAGSIRARLSEEQANQAIPVVDDDAGATIYKALPIEGYIQGQSGHANALELAEQDIVDRLNNFDYENQL
jgi:hypothetical protein